MKSINPSLDILELLDSPNETEANEYKCWMDIASEKSQRDIAKYIAALANFGGGYLVFGFNDEDLSPDIAVPVDYKKTYNRDFINSAIGSAFLEPSLHCDVFELRSSLGNIHIIVRIPSHGATPICLRKGGPSFDGTQHGAIQKDVYYIRKPGPKSEPILRASEWKAVIQRCVLHEREQILRALHQLSGLIDSAPSQTTRKTLGKTASEISDLMAKDFLSKFMGVL